MTYTKQGRWAEVEIQYLGEPETESQDVYIMNDKAIYEQLANDDAFDSRVWFYFQDEAEFKSYFNKANGDDWFIVREIEESK
jgi:hypothetical protein